MQIFGSTVGGRGEWRQSWENKESRGLSDALRELREINPIFGIGVKGVPPNGVDGEWGSELNCLPC